MNHFTRLTILLVLMIAPNAYAANCSLRNPDRQIYEIFPKATTYRSVVANVGDEQMAFVKEKYAVDLAFTDRGKHTLYIVMTDGVPIGFVHARVEVGVRGSVELVWALDLDMRILDFRVQRSREKHTEEIKSDSLRNILIGRDLYSMKDLINADGDADLVSLKMSKDAQSIANCVIYCGLKTFSVTFSAFDAPLAQARLLGNVHRIFPGTEKVKRIADPLQGMDESLPFKADSLTALRAVDVNGSTLGILIYILGEYEFWCGIDSKGLIKYAVVDTTNDTEFARSVEALHGTDLAAAEKIESGLLRNHVVMVLEIASRNGSNNTNRIVTGE